MRAAREADVQFARQQAERMKKLYDAGAVSQQEYEQAATAVQTTQAQLQAVDAQIREQRVELAYHNVTAPTAGIVGDIPVRVGDRVTQIHDPHDGRRKRRPRVVHQRARAAGSGPRTGLPVRMLDDAGAPMGATAGELRVAVGGSVDAIGPGQSADRRTTCRCGPISLRACDVVWSSRAWPDVPLVAVHRESTVSFSCSSKRRGRHGNGASAAGAAGPACRQRLRRRSSGVKEGEKLIVSGTQKIRRRRASAGDDGPVPRRRHRPPQRRRRNGNVQRYLHPPTDSGDGLLAAHHSCRRDRHSDRCRSRATRSWRRRRSASRAFYTGANAQAVESAVTTPLEQAINGVEGMTYMQSSSTNSGVSTITVSFDVGRDPDLAAIDVQNRVNQALGRMPTDVRTTGITVLKNTTGFLGGLGFFSKDNRYDAQFLSNYVDLYVKDALKRVPGVGNIFIFGERKFAMRLWLDPAKLAARNISAGDVVSALREQNLQVAAGALGDAPAPAEQTYQISVRAMGRLTEATQFEDVVIKAGSDGALVRVRDVGRVELGAETYSSNLRFGGLEATGVGIQLLPIGERARRCSRACMAEMERLERSFPPGLEWTMAFDNVGVVRESIIEVLKTLAEAIGLVILVMFIFLQNWRSTIIPAITIPVSLIGTFAFLKLFGFSINTLTLFGIVLATGIVVDDAIVVIENIERHMREYGKSAQQAAIDAMREVFGAVVVIGIVLVAVFVPIAFFPGTTGRLYQQFSLTIAFAIVLSVFNAVTLTPAICGAAARSRAPRARAVLHAASIAASTAARASTRALSARRCSGGW